MVPYSNIRINWRTLPDKGDSPREAYLTHYLHSKGTEHSRYFIKQAFEYLKEIGLSPRDARKIRQVAWDIPFPPPVRPRFSFADLYCGAGGFRLSLQTIGGKCIFSSEADYHAQRTYECNFGEVPFGNLQDMGDEDIPDHDILVASLEDDALLRMTELARIIKEKNPKAIILENTKGLPDFHNDKTVKSILKTLRKTLGYYVPEPTILNSSNFGLPQDRERLFIVGFHESTGITDFEYPKPNSAKVSFSSIKEQEVVSSKYYLSAAYVQSVKSEGKENHLESEVIPNNGIAEAVVSGMSRDKNLILDYRLTDFTAENIKGEVNREGIRKMTPREWARLQGFPDRFQITVSDTQAYKQLGNSVTVNAAQAIGKAVIDQLEFYS